MIPAGQQADEPRRAGRGRGGLNPSPGTGELGFSAVALHASRHKASADFYTQTILSSKSRALIPWFCLVEAGVAGEPNPLQISDGCGFVYNKSRGSWEANPLEISDGCGFV